MQGWGREVMDARCEGNLEESMWRLWQYFDICFQIAKVFV